MTIEITKRVEMRKVSGIVVLFFPHGLFVRASGPLVDAALYLITTDTTRQHPGRGRGFNTYHHKCKGNNFERDGCEVFMEDNADIVLILEPRDIDNFLDYGVSIWMMWAPAKIELL
jgi:hypothetical protein